MSGVPLTPPGGLAGGPTGEFDPREIIARMRADYWQGLAAPPEAEPTEQLTCAVFDVGPGRYGVPVTRVREVLKPPMVARLPRTPEFVLGVVNVRGRVVPVLDPRPLLGHPGRPNDRETRLLVLRLGDDDVGLRVDRVHGLVEFAVCDLAAPPALGASARREFLRGQIQIADKLLVVLDVDGLLAHCREALMGR